MGARTLEPPLPVGTSWEALAFVFAALPGIVAIAYAYECGISGGKPTLAGYLRMLRGSNEAKNEACEEVARRIALGRHEVVTGLVLGLILLGISVSRPGASVVLFTLGGSLVISAFAYRMGLRRRQIQ